MYTGSIYDAVIPELGAAVEFISGSTNLSNRSIFFSLHKGLVPSAVEAVMCQLDTLHDFSCKMLPLSGGSFNG